MGKYGSDLRRKKYITFRYKHLGAKKWDVVQFSRKEMETKLRKVIFSPHVFPEIEAILLPIITSILKKNKDKIIEEFLK